ncbi:MAG: hypothetical protein M1426_02310 [Patescibacteria group bacterium]|nr:hypothetical protein [Patescibacteria group bacterium]
MSKILYTAVDETMRGKIKIDATQGYFKTSNTNGGLAFFVPKPGFNILGMVIKDVLPVLDVDIKQTIVPLKTGKDYDGALTYIHKVKNGHDIYFFANSTMQNMESEVVLRGKKNLAIWNPHSGEKLPAQMGNEKAGAEDVTKIRLVLPPVTSLFYISE